MAYNKVIYGGKTLIDLSSATATADKILSGYTAYGKSGAKLTGTASAAGGALVVTAPAGVTASVTKGSKTETKTVGTGGTATFHGLEAGTWVVKIVRGSETATKSVIIKTDYAVTLTFSTIPAFTYTGSFQIVDDNDNPITTSSGNWKIRFLTSGTLKFTDLRGLKTALTYSWLAAAEAALLLVLAAVMLLIIAMAPAGRRRIHENEQKCQCVHIIVLYHHSWRRRRSGQGRRRNDCLRLHRKRRQGRNECKRRKRWFRRLRRYMGRSRRLRGRRRRK